MCLIRLHQASFAVAPEHQFEGAPPNTEDLVRVGVFFPLAEFHARGNSSAEVKTTVINDASRLAGLSSAFRSGCDGSTQSAECLPCKLEINIMLCAFILQFTIKN